MSGTDSLSCFAFSRWNHAVDGAGVKGDSTQRSQRPDCRPFPERWGRFGVRHAEQDRFWHGVKFSPVRTARSPRQGATAIPVLEDRYKESRRELARHYSYRG